MGNSDAKLEEGKRAKQVIWENYLYDMDRYLRYSSTQAEERNAKQLEARIFADYHMIEKGLALKEPRLGFGKDHIQSLIETIREYIQNGYSDENRVVSAALAVLSEYIDYHTTRGFDVSKYDQTIAYFQRFTEKGIGGTRVFTKQGMLQISKADFSLFASNRFSVRNYSEKPVPLESIKRAIKLAQKTPSVCNRQTCKVYVIEDKEIQRKALACHEGNRGFGHLADKLLLVTSDLHAFEGEHERNQPFIDGGMFAMSLIYGLHYEGLAACTMNWCATKEQDLKLRASLPIPESENVILLVTVGQYPDQFSVPKSYRKPTESVYTII